MTKPHHYFSRMILKSDEKVCPLTGLVGNFVHWMLVAEWADHMARKAEIPIFGKSQKTGRGWYNTVDAFT